MKNIFLSLISVLILYGMLVFVSPQTASIISWALWIEALQNKIVELKWDLDIASTSYTWSILSGALDLSSQIIDGVDNTKEKIDSVRQTLHEVDQWIDTVKSSYNDIVNVIQQVSEVVDVAENLSHDIQNIISTGAIQ